MVLLKVFLQPSPVPGSQRFESVFEFDGDRPLHSQMQTLVEKMQALLPEDAEKPHWSNYTLRVASSGAYLDADAADEVLRSGLAVLGEDIDNAPMLELTVFVEYRAADYIAALESGDAAATKANVFLLRYELDVDPYFAEAFITAGGLHDLLHIIVEQESGSNIQNYALTALKRAMGYCSGLEEFLSNPQLILALFDLTKASVVSTVCRQALELLFVICSFHGWEGVHGAAQETAVARGEQPYQSLVQLLESGDADVCTNSLTLINSVVANAPTEQVTAGIITHLEKIGLSDVLKRVAKKNADAVFRQLVAEYDQLRMLHMREIKSQKGGGKIIDSSDFSGEEVAHMLEVNREQKHVIQALRSQLAVYRAAVQKAVDNDGRLGDTEELAAQLMQLSRQAAAMSESGGGAGAGGAGGDGDSSPAASSASRSSYSMLKGAMGTFRRGKTAQNRARSASLSKGSSATSLDTGGGGLMVPKLSGLGGAPSSPRGSASAILSPRFMTPRGQFKQGSALDAADADWNAPPTSTRPGAAAIPPPPMAGGAGVAIPSAPPMRAAVQPTKPVIKPIKPMKPLHWDRVLLTEEQRAAAAAAAAAAATAAADGDGEANAAAPPIVWALVEDVDFDEERFADRFCQIKKAPAKLPVAAGAGGGGGGVGAGGADFKGVLRVLAPKRSQQISILSKKLPTPDKLVQAIRALDSEALSKEDLLRLQDVLPSEEEMVAVREAQESAEADTHVKLDQPEAFLLGLCDVPAVKKRAACWLFTYTYRERHAGLKPRARGIRAALFSLRKSEGLRTALGLVLALGNYLNAENERRGRADGFRIELLPKLASFKDSFNRATIIEWMVNFCKEKVREDPRSKLQRVLELHLELAGVIRAAQLDLRELERHAQNLRDALNQHRQLSRDVEMLGNGADDPEHDPFCVRMPAFFERAGELMRDLFAVIEGAKRDTEAVKRFFGAGDGMSCKELLNTFAAFLKPLGTASALKRRSVAPQAPGQANVQATVKRLGDMDAIISGLKAGGDRSKVVAEGRRAMDEAKEAAAAAKMLELSFVESVTTRQESPAPEEEQKAVQHQQLLGAQAASAAAARRSSSLAESTTPAKLKEAKVPEIITEDTSSAEPAAPVEAAAPTKTKEEVRAELRRELALDSVGEDARVESGAGAGDTAATTAEPQPTPPSASSSSGRSREHRHSKGSASERKKEHKSKRKSKSIETTGPPPASKLPEVPDLPPLPPMP